jgi:selenocysteine lyase/cysteine desulfurase
MGRQRVDSALRISPHYYNTEDEVDRFVAALHDVC